VNRGLQELGDDALPEEQGNVLWVPTTYQPIDLALNPPEPTMPGTAPGTESSGDRGTATQRAARPEQGSEGTAAERRVAALKAWEQRSLTALSHFGQADCRCRGRVLSEIEHTEIRGGLKNCNSADQVRALFAQYLPQSLEDEFPPVYHTSAQAYERQQIAAKWAARRLEAERGA
jgi:hypothetical protein